MNNKIWLGVGAAFLVGFFAGREQMKYQIVGAFVDAAHEFTANLAKPPEPAKAVTASTTATVTQSVAAPPAVANPEPPKVDPRAEALAYARQFVEVYDVTAAIRNSALSGRVPGIDLKLRNKGDKTLQTVAVTAYFKDATGTRISEELFVPVNAGSIYSTSINVPLKPGYIWQQEKGRFFAAKQVPAEWKEGAVDIEITRAEFAE